MSRWELLVDDDWNPPSESIVTGDQANARILHDDRNDPPIVSTSFEDEENEKELMLLFNLLPRSVMESLHEKCQGHSFHDLMEIFFQQGEN